MPKGFGTQGIAFGKDTKTTFHRGLGTLYLWSFD